MTVSDSVGRCQVQADTTGPETDQEELHLALHEALDRRTAIGYIAGQH